MRSKQVADVLAGWYARKILVGAKDPQERAVSFVRFYARIEGHLAPVLKDATGALPDNAAYSLLELLDDTAISFLRDQGDAAADWLAKGYLSAYAAFAKAVDDAPGVDPHSCGAVRLAGDMIKRHTADSLQLGANEPEAIGAWMGTVFSTVLGGVFAANKEATKEEASEAWNVTLRLLPRPEEAVDDLDSTDPQVVGSWVVRLYHTVLQELRQLER